MGVKIAGDSSFPANFILAEVAECCRDGMIINLFDPTTGWREMLDDGAGKDGVVVLSSVSVYGLEDGDNIPADTATFPREAMAARFLEQESAIQSVCRRMSVPVVILRCVDMIGTGMTGRWRDVANGIYRAAYYHVRGNMAETSVVHAADVAKMAVKALGMNGVYVVTDGKRRLVRDVAEALSVRIDHKRIPVFSVRQAKAEAVAADLLTLGKAGRRRWLRKQCQSLTFDGKPLLDALRYEPMDTLDFLKHHQYSDEDI